MNDKFLTPEEWLKQHCFYNDMRDSDQDEINDMLWTNNVIDYMQRYVDYVKQYDHILEMD